MDSVTWPAYVSTLCVSMPSPLFTSLFSSRHSSPVWPFYAFAAGDFATTIMTESSLIHEYTQQRDLLLERRNQLRQKLQARSEPQPKRRRIETVARTLDTYQYSKSLIAKYSRLPEMDMDLRLEYVRMTCPWMSVPSVKKEKSANTDTLLCQTILHFDTYGDFVVELTIDTESERVRNLNINATPHVENIDEQKSITALVKTSTHNLDVSRFVYGINTLLRMRHKRKRAWMSVLEDLDLSKIHAINAFPISAVLKKDSLGKMLFEHSPSLVEFQLSSKKILRINWYIRFVENSRHCVSDFAASVAGDHGDSPTENVTKLLKSLIRAHDVKLAILQILNIL